MKGNYTAKHNNHQAATHRDRKNDYSRNDTVDYDARQDENDSDTHNDTHNYEFLANGRYC